ncbi:MAG TPA: hypothetical protein VF214_05345, partial [Edaphobacter sp.]
MSTMMFATSQASDAGSALYEMDAPVPLMFPVTPGGNVDLTIHRRTDTHHGVTLRLLGHAAEYLVESRMFAASDSKADQEAVHILMRLSREIFEEYAEGVRV